MVLLSIIIIHLVKSKRNRLHFTNISSHLYKHTIAVPSPVINRNPIMEEMAGNLKVMIDRRSDILPSQRTNRITENNDFNWCKGNVFVQNWIDCTPCYGFTYRLSDGTMGVLYNDGSTMTSVDNQ